MYDTILGFYAVWFWSLLAIALAVTAWRMGFFGWCRGAARKGTWKARVFFGLTGGVVSAEGWSEWMQVAKGDVESASDSGESPMSSGGEFKAAAEEAIAEQRRLAVLAAGRGRVFIPLREWLAARLAYKDSGEPVATGEGAERSPNDGFPTSRQATGYFLCFIGSLVAFVFADIASSDWNLATQSDWSVLVLVSFSALVFLAVVQWVLCKEREAGEDVSFVLPAWVWRKVYYGTVLVTLCFLAFGFHDGIFIVVEHARGHYEVVEEAPGWKATTVALSSRVITATPTCCRKTAGEIAEGDGRTGHCSTDGFARLGEYNVRAYAHVPLRHTAHGIERMLKLEENGASFADDYAATHARVNAIVSRELTVALSSAVNELGEPPMAPDTRMAAGTPEVSLAEAAHKVALADWQAGLRQYLAKELPKRLNPEMLESNLAGMALQEEQNAAMGVSTHIQWDKVRLVKVNFAKTEPAPTTGQGVNCEMGCPIVGWHNHHREPEATGAMHHAEAGQRAPYHVPSKAEMANRSRQGEGMVDIPGRAKPFSGEPPAIWGPSAGAGSIDEHKLIVFPSVKRPAPPPCKHDSDLGHANGRCPDQDWCDHGGGHGHYWKSSGLYCDSCLVNGPESHYIGEEHCSEREQVKGSKVEPESHKSQMGGYLGDAPKYAGPVAGRCYHEAMHGDHEGECPDVAAWHQAIWLGVAGGSRPSLYRAGGGAELPLPPELEYLVGASPRFLIARDDPTRFEVRFVYRGEDGNVSYDLTATELRKLRQAGEQFKPPGGWWTPTFVREFGASLEALVKQGQMTNEEAGQAMKLRMSNISTSSLQAYIRRLVAEGRLNPAIAEALIEK
ncbi:MAG: hypothetical protein COV10_03655 [Candidatus Vogelbacteria bacterium CG10_big_fil_rev_8_21_14_0_10_51_16]|uniref:Uncharacterized protein n=1 Tax=Candidatus Vogelbacteria bacterium CG10_big_fil_rev_8_21_14_0_10_51_16 TaxID=1975045 RepID=A0A2H0RDM2_9BACT|nr:MAG: hypothetical protein COV10_03655 [Candidatus Vogelbacteria bacterium CG10_big_fil_rev_8_21_14_0_10_51_16]